LLAKFFPDNKELQWRLTLGLGAIPAAVVMFYSMGQKESTEFQAAKQEVSFMAALKKREYWGKLIGTGGGWFCYDIVHYGPYLIAPVIIADIFNTEGQEDSVDTVAWQTCFANMIGVPGVLTCIFLYKYMGTKNQQWIGFLFIALSFFLMGGLYDTIDDLSLFFLFCVMTYGINSGPSVTTFVLPSETFPAEVRSTFNGLSAAMGKTGATIITFLDYWLMNWYGIRANLYLYGVVGILGAIITLFFVEDIDSDRLKSRSKVTEEKSINKAAKHTEYV
jgi:PHS family inorganic phosphate transporter-like MFS transporter